MDEMTQGLKETEYGKAMNELGKVVGTLLDMVTGLETRLEEVMVPVREPKEPQLLAEGQAPHSPLVHSLNEHTETIQEVISKLRGIMGRLEI